MCTRAWPYVHRNYKDRSSSSILVICSIVRWFYIIDAQTFGLRAIGYEKRNLRAAALVVYKLRRLPSEKRERERVETDVSAGERRSARNRRRSGMYVGRPEEVRLDSTVILRYCCCCCNGWRESRKERSCIGQCGNTTIGCHVRQSKGWRYCLGLLMTGSAFERALYIDIEYLRARELVD